MEILHHKRTCVPLWCILLWFCCSNVIRTSEIPSSRPQKLYNLLKSLKNYPEPEMDFIDSSKGMKNQSHIASTTTAPPIQTSSAPDISNDTSSQNVTSSHPASTQNLTSSHPASSQNVTSSHPTSTPSVSSYEEFYRIFYGTEEGVKNLRSEYGPRQLHKARARFGGVNEELENVKKANDHFLRIRNRARCKEPAPRVIRVKDYYPDPSREYVPRCTLLHTCSDSTGCCDSDAFHCVATEIQAVTLTFYTLTVDKNGLSYRAGDGIQKLLFDNHTACDCLPVNDMPRTQNQAPQDGVAPDHHENHPKNHRKKPRCRECPVPFTSRIYRNGRCGCDCFDRQKPCLRIKRGREPLSAVERRCVESNYCHSPDCEYGVFDSRSGYCPRRHDDDRPQHPKSHHPKSETPGRHKWSYRERD